MKHVRLKFNIIRVSMADEPTLKPVIHLCDGNVHLDVRKYKQNIRKMVIYFYFANLRKPLWHECCKYLRCSGYFEISPKYKERQKVTGVYAVTHLCRFDTRNSDKKWEHVEYSWLYESALHISIYLWSIVSLYQTISITAFTSSQTYITTLLGYDDIFL